MDTPNDFVIYTGDNVVNVDWSSTSVTHDFSHTPLLKGAEFKRMLVGDARYVFAYHRTNQAGVAIAVIYDINYERQWSCRVPLVDLISLEDRTAGDWRKDGF